MVDFLTYDSLRSSKQHFDGEFDRQIISDRHGTLNGTRSLDQILRKSTIFNYSTMMITIFNYQL